MKPFDEYSIPSRFFNCEPIIINDVADVNALVTGTDIKSTIKPKPKCKTMLFKGAYKVETSR